MSRTTLLLAFAWLASFGCEGEISGSDPGEELPEGPAVDPSPRREPVGSAEFLPARQVRRMSADQFRRSVERATGETWDDYEEVAGALGRADLAEITEESGIVNVTFAKVVDDVARQLCDDAVDADLERDAADRVILRFADVDSTDAAAIDANLQYLLLRFWATDVPLDDERLVPWRTLLRDAEDMGDAERWKLACIGLLTHPNFFTY